MNTLKKLAELDVLRALAFFAVVLQHAIGHYAYIPGVTLADGVTLGALLLLAKFAVPAFIFISGMVMFLKEPAQPTPYFTLLRKRWKDIALPYLAWAALYGSIDNDRLVWPDPATLGWQLLSGKASYHLWYVVMLAQFYLLFPLFRAGVLWLNRRLPGKRIGVALLGLGLLYAGLMQLVWPISQWAEQANLPVLTPLFGEYGDRNVLYFYFYFVMGAFAGLRLDAFRAWLMRRAAAVLCVYAALLLWTLHRIVAHLELVPELKIQYNDTLLLQPAMALFLVASVLAMLLCADFIARRSSDRCRSLLASAASYSYVAYLAHALMLTFATKLADRLLWFSGATGRTLAAFALCSALALATAVALRRLAAVVRLRPGKRTPSADAGS